MSVPLTEYTLILTEDCNLRCKYCYVKKDPIKMSIEIADKVIDFVIKNALLYGDSRIDAFGGEPLLNKDVLFHIIERTHAFNSEHNVRIDVTIFTNGTLLTRDMLLYTKQFDHVRYNISQDGCHEAHDLTRIYENGSGSFDTVIRGISLYKEIYNQDIISKFMVSPDNMKFLPDSIQYMIDNHIYRMSISMIRDDVWNDTNLIELESILKKAARLYIDNIDILWIDLFLIPILDYQYSSSTYCGAGKKMVGISPDGGIYPCQRFYNIDRIKYKLGDVINGIDYESNDYILFNNFSSNRNLLDCKKCDTFKYFNCTGQCMAACFSSCGTIFKCIPGVCKMLKLLYKVSLDIYNEVKDNDNYKRTLDINNYGG